MWCAMKLAIRRLNRSSPPVRYHQNLHICGTRFRRTPRLAVPGHKTFHIPDIGLHARSLALYSAKGPSRENCLVCPVGGIDIHRSKAQNTGAHVNLRRVNPKHSIFQASAGNRAFRLAPYAQGPGRENDVVCPVGGIDIHRS